MNKFLINPKKLGFTLLSLLIFSSSSLSCLMASPVPNVTSTPDTSKSAAPSTDIKDNAPRSPHEHHKGKRPFKRFTAALEILEQKNIVSKDDVRKIMKALMQLSIDALTRTDDPDQAAADALLRDKVLSTEQHQKLTDLLKASAKAH